MAFFGGLFKRGANALADATATPQPRDQGERIGFYPQEVFMVDRFQGTPRYVHQRVSLPDPGAMAYALVSFAPQIVGRIPQGTEYRVNAWRAFQPPKIAATQAVAVVGMGRQFAPPVSQPLYDRRNRRSG